LAGLALSTTSPAKLWDWNRSSNGNQAAAGRRHGN